MCISSISDGGGPEKRQNKKQRRGGGPEDGEPGKGIALKGDGE